MPSSRAQALAMKIAAAAGDGAGAGAPPVPEPAAPNSWFADHATFQDEARALVDALPGAPEFSCVDPGCKLRCLGGHTVESLVKIVAAALSRPADVDRAVLAAISGIIGDRGDTRRSEVVRTRTTNHYMYGGVQCCPDAMFFLLATSKNSFGRASTRFVEDGGAWGGVRKW